METELRTVFEKVLRFLNTCPFQKMNNKMLLQSYTMVCQLRCILSGKHPLEFGVLEYYYLCLQTELEERGNLPTVILVCTDEKLLKEGASALAFSEDGRLISGQETLRALFVNMPLEQMRKIIDEMCEKQLTDAQKETLLRYVAENVLSED